MKKIFLLIFTLSGFLQVNAQSGLYQTAIEKDIDEAYELFHKNQYSAAKYEFEYLKEKDLSPSQRVEVDFYHALAALRIENPDGPGLMEKIRVNYPDDPKSNQASLLLGDYYFDQRHYKTALKHYGQFNTNVALAEQKAELWFKMGYAYFKLGDYTNARRYFDPVKKIPSPLIADGYYYSGFSALKLENYQIAIQDFKQADRYPSYQSKVPYMLSEAYYRQQQYEELIQYVTPILKSRSALDQKEEIYLLLAEAYFEKRDFTQAANYYDASSKSGNGNLSREQKYKAGVAQFKVDNPQKATNYFKEVALEKDRLGQVSSYYLGHSYLKLNNDQFALTSFNTAYKGDFDPEIKSEALYNFAKINLEKGSFKEAVNALDTYLDRFPQGAQVQQVENLLSDALINTNNYLRAIQHIEQMGQKSNRIKAAYQKVSFYQGITYFRNKRYKEAIIYFDKSLSYPIDQDIVSQAHFWKGETYMADENPNPAIRSYEQVVQMGTRAEPETLLKTHYGLGYAYFNTQQYHKAATQFKAYTDKLRGAREQAHYEDALIRLGDSYYVQKKFENALQAYRNAIQLRRSFSDYAHYMAGVALNFQNRNQEAIAQLDQVIDGFPNSPYRDDVIFKKAQINMEESDYSKAREGFSLLIQERPNSPYVPYALESRAIANYSLQNYKSTISDYKKILDSYPNAENVDAALVGLQEALSLEGRSGEFSEYLASYKNANPGNESLQNIEYEAAKNLFFSQSYQEAIKAFKGYLKSYPNSSHNQEAQYFIGDAYYRLEQYDKALEAFYELEDKGASSQKAKAISKIAELEFKNKNYLKAVPYYLSSSKNARDRIEEFEAFNGLMESYYQIGRFDSAIYFADKVIQMGDITANATSKGYLVKAKSFLEKGETTKAQDELMALLNQSESVEGAEGLYLLAKTFHESGNYKQSNETIFDFSDRYAVHDYWYGRCFILLGKNYLELKENFQAKATLESIIENSENQEVVEEAQKVLESI
ncbi:tetratricopeptide repeat protein [Echinicola jeungdonensis]|uniref:Tetratricopeptide repeat protein n=1 Tax=Echinicola jeungdonensis TaxID=709343 RepID=A0ABV5J5H4_9BACT|nr:tetratricopeptide repeat protein [Echinicola jeungdonensis]MDN3670881.1 tetratricopeptide repeat protein [Echinicola jeungdonensis]